MFVTDGMSTFSVFSPFVVEQKQMVICVLQQMDQQGGVNKYVVLVVLCILPVSPSLELTPVSHE